MAACGELRASCMRRAGCKHAFAELGACACMLIEPLAPAWARLGLLDWEWVVVLKSHHVVGGTCILHWTYAETLQEAFCQIKTDL